MVMDAYLIKVYASVKKKRKGRENVDERRNNTNDIHDCERINKISQNMHNIRLKIRSDHHIRRILLCSGFTRCSFRDEHNLVIMYKGCFTWLKSNVGIAKWP